MKLTKSEEINDWERDFNEKWIELYESNISRTSYTTVSEDVKEFIRQQREEVLEEVAEMIEKMKKIEMVSEYFCKDSEKQFHNFEYNQALRDIKEALKKLQEK